MYGTGACRLTRRLLIRWSQVRILPGVPQIQDSLVAALADHRATAGFAPQVRIGLRVAEATRRGRDYSGKGIHEAARIAALGNGGEILASRVTLDGVSRAFTISQPRTVTLKGIAEPMEIVALVWR